MLVRSVDLYANSMAECFKSMVPPRPGRNGARRCSRSNGATVRAGWIILSTNYRGTAWHGGGVVTEPAVWMKSRHDRPWAGTISIWDIKGWLREARCVHPQAMVMSRPFAAALFASICIEVQRLEYVDYLLSTQDSRHQTLRRIETACLACSSSWGH